MQGNPRTVGFHPQLLRPYPQDARGSPLSSGMNVSPVSAHAGKPSHAADTSEHPRPHAVAVQDTPSMMTSSGRLIRSSRILQTDWIQGYRNSQPIILILPGKDM